MSLAAELAAASSRHWAWGYHDCLMFAAHCVWAKTGIDYAAQFPFYDSEEGANVILAEHGSIVGLISHVLGEPLPPSELQDGCVIVAHLPQQTAGIYYAGGAVFARFPYGLTQLPASVVTHVWRV